MDDKKTLSSEEKLEIEKFIQGGFQFGIIVLLIFSLVRKANYYPFLGLLFLNWSLKHLGRYKFTRAKSDLIGGIGAGFVTLGNFLIYFAK